MPSPLTYSAYPDADDVMTLLAGAEITVPDNLDVDALIAEAIDEWEQATRYRPFLGAAAAADYRYDPPGPNRTGLTRGGGKILRLGRGFVADADADITVTVGVTADDPVGTVLVEGTDYQLLPLNAIADLVPYTSLEFFTFQWGQPGSIVLNGKAGYSVELRADVWGAIRKKGAAKVLEAIQERFASDNVIEEKSGDDQIKYGFDPKQAGLWNAEADRVRLRCTLLS